jgi:hypothetical protein
MLEPMCAQTTNGDVTKSVVIVCLLVLALAVIALSVSVMAQHSFSGSPQLVHDDAELVSGRI